MKFSFFILFLGILFVSLPACNSEKKAEPTPAETEVPAITPATGEVNPGAVPPTITTTPSPTPDPAPAQNAKGVWHYTCSKGCPGGAGVGGNCPKCSTPLTHNQGYHQQ